MAVATTAAAPTPASTRGQKSPNTSTETAISRAAITATTCSIPARFGSTIASPTIVATTSPAVNQARQRNAMQIASATTAAEGPVSRTCATHFGNPKRWSGPIATPTRANSVPAMVQV